MSTRIMHLDLDAFFVEVCRRHNAELRDIDLLVVGGRRESRGVVQSASYGARKFGIHAGMPIAQAARLCPGATFFRGEFAQYRIASTQVRTILEQHAPRVVMAGLDEGYLDFSGTDLLHPVSLLPAAEAIREAVRHGSGLDSSIGIGPNRMIAKIASAHAKPKGICEVRQGWEKGFMAGLPLSVIPGIGPRMSERLAALGLTLVAQVQSLSLDQLSNLIGRQEARLLLWRASGGGSQVLSEDQQAKSVSRETTFSRDLHDPMELDRVLLLLTTRVAAQLRAARLEAGIVTIKLRHGDFRTVTRRRTLDTPTALDQELLTVARELLAPALAEAHQRHQGVRLLGIGTSGLIPVQPPDLFEPVERARQRKAASAVDAVRARFGVQAVERAALLRQRPGKTTKPPSHGGSAGDKQ